MREVTPEKVQAARDRAKAWAFANPERARANKLRHYLKTRPEPKPVLSEHERLEASITRVPESGCWIWTKSINRSGYGKTKVRGKDVTAHRWSYELHKGPIPDGLHVCHSCDVRACVNPAHLWLGTHKDNNDDMIKKGRQATHIPTPTRKLTEDEVREIRAKRGIVRIVDLAKQYGVDYSNISRIHTGKHYAHVS